MSASDTEFDFDCPRFAFDLNSSCSQSGSPTNYVDPWFLIYHSDHDRKAPSKICDETKKNSRGRSSGSAALKANSSHLGPARISKRTSSVPTAPVNLSSAHPPAGRGTHRGEELKTEEPKSKLASRTDSLSIGSKRKSNSDDSIGSCEIAQTAPSTDMRDKLDEFRQRKKRENATDNAGSSKISAPLTDYSRSKIVISDGNTQSRASTIRNSAPPVKAPVAVNKQQNPRAHHVPASVSTQSRAAVDSAKAISRVTRVGQKPPIECATKSSSSRKDNVGVSSYRSDVPRRGQSAPSADDEICTLELLKKHNQRFAPVPIYEPPRHSVRDVRKWEKESGKSWQTLSPEEREVVNAEIGRMKKKASEAVQ